ncbi:MULTISPECIES: ABC transporter ATP-binding protein [unclassified Rhizobium]|uniref:ABC transporter ATP-binding protein n=1 Tax=unclassified Rhizobium TaxID=2613769 RepID=UPI001ADCC53F|nr:MULTISPECIES: ABC transporter ATP-binding protein [unclassified Rhizobium]MBO9127075.1 ABC transporter ATP-binding protein [Rhizobium sp. 16-488-2b]MBO9177522.1 ABC transporter ATP-binding protein [Rhizobium sp. 16-488-2a]
MESGLNSVANTVASSRGTARLELDGLSRSFGAYNALDGIDLAIEPGEFVALLGPSGCGKSTALNCIAGLLGLSGGEIRLGGKRIDQLEPERRGFGMVFQSYALFPHMSVRKNVGFGLSMQGIKGPEADKRINDALALVRLESQADKLPGQLSGGQQQRVAIARAIVIRPPIVLMDEPLSNLDAKLRLEMRAEIRGIHDQIGSTTIYVTHDQDEALSLADRIVVMSQGHIEQIGSPQDLYQRPVNVGVADFMGFRTRVPGKVVSVSGDEAEIDVAGARITGTMRTPLKPGDAAIFSVRPEDLVAADEGIAAIVSSMEYRGRAFFGLARSADGSDLYFRADDALPRGTATRLKPIAGRALVFGGSAR